VVCRDQSVLAQLGTPDMRVPIAYGLSFPERIASGASALDLLGMKDLSFEAPERERFPGLFLAWDALKAPHGSTAILNAANEVAVAAFLDGQIGFAAIHQVNAGTLDGLLPGLDPDASIEALWALDARARAHAGALARRLAR
jgi:1-deoxy-D-xylulose-5-phosphate reductoisomerase